MVSLDTQHYTKNTFSIWYLKLRVSRFFLLCSRNLIVHNTQLHCASLFSITPHLIIVAPSPLGFQLSRKPIDATQTYDQHNKSPCAWPQSLCIIHICIAPYFFFQNFFAMFSYSFRPSLSSSPLSDLVFTF